MALKYNIFLDPTNELVRDNNSKILFQYPSVTPSLTPSVTITPSITPSLTPSITPSVTPYPLLGASPVTLTSSAYYTIPPGVTQLAIQCWGGGAGGSNGPTGIPTYGGGGGGGGGYGSATVPVTPGKAYLFTVGAGGAASSNGGFTRFIDDNLTQVYGNGGIRVLNSTTGGNGGTGGYNGGGGIGYSGGNGGSAVGLGGGGGGEGACTDSNGENGDDSVGTSGALGGSLTGCVGGNGGRGGNYPNGSGVGGGSITGGGGGGSGGGIDLPGTGARGEMIITY